MAITSNNLEPGLERPTSGDWRGFLNLPVNLPGLFSVCILDVEGQEHISHATLQTGPDFSQSFDCTGRHDGAYPDYQKGCRQFYLCVSGQTHVSWCSNDTIFNPNSGYCDAPSRVRCVDLEGLAWPSLVGDCSYQEDGIYTDYTSGCRNFYFCKGGVKTVFSCDENMLFDWRTGSCRQAREVPCFPATCENQPEGLYIDNTESCKRYYLCSNGEKLEFVCPQGKIFNENIMRCDHSRTVSCPNSSFMSCNDLPDGYYPDYEDNCRIFYLCINGELKRYSCPTNLVFNKRSLTCDYPSETTCEKPTNAACEHEPNGVYSLTETGCREFKICREGYTVHSGVCSRGKLMNSATSRCESRSLLTCASVTDSDCEDKADGIYPDINIGCSAYFLCFRYRKVVTRFCPPSTLFDYTSNTCLSSSLVYCHHFGDEPSFRHYAISQYNCEGRLGLFPDFITGCRRYYICAYGRRDVAVCPEGLRFNGITKQCQEPGSVHCRAPQVVGTFQCLKSEEGIYIDVNSGCKRWHECWNEVGGTYSCPPRSWFNVMTRTCDTDDNIRCQNGGAELFDLSTFKSRKNRTLQNSETPFTCREKPNGLYFLGEQNCKVFYICSNGKTFSFMCPEGQIYNPKSESCEDTLQISCQQIKEQWTQNNEEFSCVSKTDGLYPHDSFNCEKFFICENGRKITVYCPKIHFFNTMVMICDLKSHAKCISVIKPEESNSSAVRISRTHKGNTTFSLRANRSPLSKKQDHGFLREQKLNVRKEKTNKENRNRFVDTYLTTGVPVEYDYVDYEFFDYPDSYNDTAEEGKHFGVRRTFYKERHFGKDHNGKTVLSVVDQRNDKGISNGGRSVNWEYKTQNVNSQTQNGEVTTNMRSDYDYSYHIGDEYFDPYSDKRNARRNVFEDESFALGSSVHHTDIKDRADVKDKIFGITQKFYRSFKNDDFHQHNTSEKNKTQDDETKHVFIQLTRKNSVTHCK
ncbi:uncharacterized protein LOC143256616 [Tachypleus tridentatus]|uniref:uncharacterized protein LOC143256616 n=1 Tax=Tachypleus tridentatus TaxID=6853 RepID=UPI003FD079D8